MSHRPRRGLTRAEWLTGLLILGAAIAWAAPHARTTLLRTRRAEAGLILEALITEQLARRDKGKGFQGFSDFPQPAAAVGTHLVAVAALPFGSASPMPALRCAYQATTKGALRITATCDVDGDGVPAVYEASPDQPLVRATPADVY